MLDSFKNLTGAGKGQRQQADELQTLIASAKDERGALSAMLTQISLRSATLAQLGKTLEQVGQKAHLATVSVHDLGRRVSALDDRLKAFDLVEKRIEALVTQVTDAQRVTERLTAPDGDLQKHRQAVNQLASQALETQATIETLRKERATLEEIRTQLRQATGDVKQSMEGTTSLRGELDGVRHAASQLSQEYQRIRDTSRAAREDAVAATESVKEIEKKLGPLVQLQELSKSTEERLASLNALAEHVSHKAKALEAQKHAIDHAAVQSHRLNEMVWTMDVQINKLTEGNKHVLRAEETIARMEKLANDTGTELETATTAREEFIREFARVEKESRTLSDYLKASVERLAV